MQSKKSLSQIFNSLSLFDKLNLYSASLTSTMTRLVLEDTKESPWKYPFYLAYMVTALSPLPFPGAGIAANVVAALCIGLAPGKWGRWMRGELKDAFNKANIMDQFDHFVSLKAQVDENQEQDTYKVDKLSLIKQTTFKSLQDSWYATSYAFVSARLYIGSCLKSVPKIK